MKETKEVKQALFKMMDAIIDLHNYTEKIELDNKHLLELQKNMDKEYSNLEEYVNVLKNVIYKMYNVDDLTRDEEMIINRIAKEKEEK